MADKVLFYVDEYKGEQPLDRRNFITHNAPSAYTFSVYSVSPQDARRLAQLDALLAVSYKKLRKAGAKNRNKLYKAEETASSLEKEINELINAKNKISKYLEGPTKKLDAHLSELRARLAEAKKTISSLSSLRREYDKLSNERKEILKRNSHGQFLWLCVPTGRKTKRMLAFFDKYDTGDAPLAAVFRPGEIVTPELIKVHKGEVFISKPWLKYEYFRALTPYDLSKSLQRPKAKPIKQ